MKRFRAQGTFTVQGVGQSHSDGTILVLPLSGRIQVAGRVNEGAVVRVEIPDTLLPVLVEKLKHPLAQLPLYREGLVGLSIERP